MKIVRSTMFSLAMVLVSLCSISSAAAASQPQQAIDLTAGPHELVQATTERVMEIIEHAKVYYDEDPARFYDEIDGVLASVVDFNSFARGVMGTYASKQRYVALTTDEEKKAYKARMYRFSDTFKNGLVQTYAKGLLAFNGNKIEVVPAKEGEDLSGKSSVTVEQLIYGDAEKPYSVQYKLRKNRSGEWKLRNVTIEAINLGKVYQSQFSSAARLYDGDIEKVIDNWSVDPTSSSDQTASVSSED